MQRRLNVLILINLVMLLTFLFSCSVYYGISTEEMYSTHWYIFDKIEMSSTEVIVRNMLSLFLIINYLVPLDLVFVYQWICIFYSYYLIRDYKMTHMVVGKKIQRLSLNRLKMNSLNLIEDLGEVDYLMTDKTGTLTKNNLTLVAACADPDSSFVSEKLRPLNQN